MPFFHNSTKVVPIIISISLLIITTLKVIAQREFVKPIAKQLTSVPFSLLPGGIILLKATLDDNQDSLTFILDTGCSGVSLDSATVVQLHLHSEKTNKIIRSVGGSRKIDFTYNHRLHLPLLIVDSLDFHINDYALLSSVYGVKIDGILGYSFFKRFVVEVNYDVQK